MQALQRFSRDRTRNLHAEIPVLDRLHGGGDTFVDTLATRSHTVAGGNR